MPRPPPTPSTALAAAIQEHREGMTLRQVGAELGVANTTLSRLERGGAPSLATARALAAWLGWSLEDVLEAAETPVSDPGPESV